MKTYGNLVLAVFLAAVLMAPPAYPQNRTETALNTLMKDMLNLKFTMTELQKSFDQKSAENKALLEQMVTRFTSLDASLGKISDALANLKATDERTARELTSVRDAVLGVQSEVKKTNEELVTLGGQVRGINKELVAIKTKEEPLPSPVTMFQEGIGMYSAGFHDLAISSFRAFLQNYPSEPSLSPAAFVFIGDSLSALQKFEEALIEYDTVLQKYPDSDRKCLALYKKGQTHAQLKQNTEATDAYNRTIKECTGTQEAENASVALKTLRGGGARGK
jgi:TolA-binding protein